MILIDEFCNYDETKTKILNAQTIEEVNKIVSDYENIKKKYHNKMEKALIYSLVDSKRFDKKINETVFTEYVDKYDIATLLTMTDDPAQIQIIKKFGKLNYNVAKRCPHCKIRFYGTKDVDYVICGYTGNIKGYDWVGCKRDWCFKCGGKLCKAWDYNELYRVENREHGDCCRRYAKKKNLNLNDFCSCRVNNYSK
jgi:hypothetical protein